MSIPTINTNFKPFPTIETERLILRKLSKKDVNEMFFLRSDERMMTYVGRKRHTRKKETLEFIRIILEQERKGESINWAITVKNDPSLKGNICLWRINKEHFRAELGYNLHYDYQGKGLMHEAVMGVLHYGFNIMNLHAVEAHASPDNKASLKVLERAGFKQEGLFRENFFFDGKFFDTAAFALLRSEYTFK